jgi:phage replication O-like protein O
MANPSIKNGHIDIANELAEKFAYTPLTGEEWRILWVVLRQTWGWKGEEIDRKKDFDYISIGYFEDKTGMKRANVARILKKLVARKLLLRSEKGYGINQNYDLWVVAPKLPLVAKKLLVAKPASSSSSQATVTSSSQANESSSSQATHNRYIDKKDIKQKIEPEKDWITDDVKTQYMAIVEKYHLADKAYADKTWDQGMSLRGENQTRFRKKIAVLLSARRQPFAEKIHTELAQLVNDKGDMERKLSEAEIKQRREFDEEEYGKKYVKDELDKPLW